MFGLLKNKISFFINNLTQKKTEETPEQQQEEKQEQPQTEKPEQKLQAETTKTEQKPFEQKPPEPPAMRKQEQPARQKPQPEKKELPAVPIKHELPERKPQLEKKDFPSTQKQQPEKKEQAATRKQFLPEKPPLVQQPPISQNQEPQKPREEKQVQPKAEKKSIQLQAEKKQFEKTEAIEKPKQTITGQEHDAVPPKTQESEQQKTASKPPSASFFDKVSGLVRKPVELISGGRQEQKRELAVSLSLESKVRSVFSSDVEIREKDVSSLLESLEFSLLESDVAFDVSRSLVEDLRKRLVGKRVKKGKLNEEIRGSVKDSLVSVLEAGKPLDFWRAVSENQKPVKILFVGPNGAGKTTTMSKLASMLLSKNYSCLFSASDTFRAAAIEQTVHHAEKLGISVVKHKYGSDPAAVAFDAVNHAKANNVSVVLIDSAGRQDTNANLIDELKKINRVVKPDLKLFVGESIAGNAIIDQVNAFHAAIGLDAVILTKLDCDAKGGTALSVSKATGVPILFIGIGQGYNDLIEFNARSIAEQILT